MFGQDFREKTESKPLEKVQMKHLIIAFLIFGVGCLVALFVFLIEMSCGTKVQEGQQGGNSENQNIEVPHLSD